MNNKQHGIALVMVLVFLTLLTLISTTAMQQNALQFAMIGNTQEQSQSLTSAENILRLAESQINQLRWSNARSANPGSPATDTQCKASAPAPNGNYNLIAPGTIINLGIAGATVEVTGWWCQNNPSTNLANDIDQDGDADTDIDDIRYGRPTAMSIAGCSIAAPADACTIPSSGFAPFPDTIAVGADDATPGFNQIGCGTELYTIRVTFMQQNTSNAERVVESKYAVKCMTVGN